MAYKCYVFVAAFSTDLTTQFAIIDISNNTVPVYGQVNLVLGTDITAYTLSEYQAATQAKVIHDFPGYSLTTPDFVWLNENLVNLEEVTASKGIVSSVIDGKTVGNTTVFTNTSSQNFLVTEYWINPTSITGLGTAPVINIGKTASTYNDIDSGISLAFANNAGKFSKRDGLTNSVSVANGESIVCRVATAAILTTTYNFKVMIRGIYL